MANRDLINNLKSVVGLVPATRTATALSSVCDTQGYEAANARFFVGAFGDTASATVFMEAELQESSDNVTYTAVADADMLFPPGAVLKVGTVATGGVFMQSKTTAANDLGSLIYEAGYRGNKRYLKVNLRLTGTHTNGTPTAVEFTLGRPDYSPASGNAT